MRGPALTVLIIAALGTFVFGSLRIATVAAATGFGSANAAGLLMGLLSVGTVAGAVVYGARTWAVSGRRLLIVICLADSVLLLTDAVAPNLAVLAVLIVCTGFLTGLRETLQPVLLALRAPAARSTEVFAWLNTVMWAGYGLGTAVAGRLTPHAGTGVPAFGVAAAGALLAAAVAATLHPPR